MGDILFLAHRIPFPPDRGDKIRSHHLLRALARIAPVHVGTFGESVQDMALRSELERLAASHCLVRRTKPLALAGAEALLSAKPVSLTAFVDRKLRQWVAETLARHPIDTIFVFSGQMGQYVPEDFAGRVVVDLCDVDSAKFEAYADAGKRPWLNRREGRLLAREEARLARRADTTLLISEEEAALFRGRLPDPAAANIAVLGNGIDAQTFDPDSVEPHPEIVAGEGPNLVFTGQMDYPPNIAAARWAIDALMPALRERYPQARFHVVGRNPPAELRRHDGTNEVRIHGEVPDMRPYLKAADIVLVPLTIARGVQNKVLEAMAMARPVLLTPEAATGIAARDGTHFAVAQAEPSAMLTAIDRILGDLQTGAELGAAARRFVVETKSWDAELAPLAGIVDRPREVRSAA